MKKQLFYLSLIILLCSCLNNKKHAVKVQSLHSEVFLTDEELNTPYWICVTDEYVVLSNTKSDTVLDIYNLQGEKVNQIMPHGEGPNEALHLMGLQYDALHKCIYIQDVSKRTTFKIMTSDLAKKEPSIISFIQLKTDNKEEFILGDWWVYTKDDRILAANTSMQGMIASFDKNKNNIKYYEPYPDKSVVNENLTDIAHIMLYQSYGVVSPQMNKVAIEYHGADILGFVQIHKDSLKVKFNKKAFPNDIYVMQSGPDFVQGAFTGESMVYYSAIAASEKYVYALWKGKKKKECENGYVRSSCVMVYDWGGNHVSELHLDTDIYQLAVSPDGNSLFALSSSPESGFSLLKYELENS